MWIYDGRHIASTGLAMLARRTTDMLAISLHDRFERPGDSARRIRSAGHRQQLNFERMLEASRSPAPAAGGAAADCGGAGPGGGVAGQAPRRPRPTRHPHPIHLPRPLRRPRHEPERLAGDCNARGADIVSGDKARRQRSTASATCVECTTTLAVVNVQDSKARSSSDRQDDSRHGQAIRRYRSKRTTCSSPRDGDPDKLGADTLWNDELRRVHSSDTMCSACA